MLTFNSLLYPNSISQFNYRAILVGVFSRLYGKDSFRGNLAVRPRTRALYKNDISGSPELGHLYQMLTLSEVSRSLGWEPQKTDEDFKNHLLEETGLILTGQNRV
jgi:hypothetical protein